MCAGALAGAPEARLAQGYAQRAGALGRRLGLGPVEIVEIGPARRGRAAEAKVLGALLDGAPLIACDRGGAMLSSREIAGLLAQLRDGGARSLAFAIGGPDGLEAPALSAASRLLSFGPQTWPHALARVMLAEQIYRAASILAGSPYHRE